MRVFLGCLGNPTLQFFAAFLVSPIFAIAGEAIGGFDSLAKLAGWFITCLLVSITAQRSFRHERKQLLPGKLFPFPRPENQRVLKYLVTIGTLWLSATAGAGFLGATILLRLLFG